MNVQPFRIVQSTSRVLHRALTIMFADNTMRPLPGMIADALNTYASFDQVPHTQLLESFVERFERERQNDAVMSSDELYLPLRVVRRAVVALTHFPINTPRHMELRRSAEACIVNDVMRLSVHDLAPADVAQIWGCAAPCTQWELIEQLASRFPLATALPLLSGAEFRDVLGLVWMAWQMAPEPAPGKDGSPLAAQRLVTRFFDVDETWRRLRDDLAAAADPILAASSSGSSALAADPSLIEVRDGCAMACVLFAATLQAQCGVAPGTTDAFPITAAEWARWVGEGKGGVDGGGVSAGVMPVPPRTIGGSALHVWYRRLRALHQECVPDYVRASFATAVVNDLVQLYQRLDHDAVVFFFEYFMPLAVDTSPFRRECKPAMRDAHNSAMARLFWASQPAAGESGSAALSVASWTSPQQRGSWTLSQELENEPTAPPSTAAQVSASCILAAGAALDVLYAELRVQEAGQPLPEAHVPAMVSMLTIVLQHLRRAIANDPVAMRNCGCSTQEANWMPSPFWGYWNVNRLSLLAVVLSGVQDRVHCAAVQTPASAELLQLSAHGTELLRPFIRVDMVEARGTGRMLTDLLSRGQRVVQDLGGAALEGQLQALALENVQNGLSRPDIAQIAQAIEARYAQQGRTVDAKAREVVAGLRAAELTMPVRQWS